MRDLHLICTADPSDRLEFEFSSPISVTRAVPVWLRIAGGSRGHTVLSVAQLRTLRDRIDRFLGDNNEPKTPEVVT
jgi:hypothetical protein